jgi:phospholipase C
MAISMSATLAALPLAQAHDGGRHETETPIKHVIIIVGENHTFDNLFGTYQPKKGQFIDNLLSKGIVKADGSPGPHFARGRQMIGVDTTQYHAETYSSGAYNTLPQPYTTA